MTRMPRPNVIAEACPMPLAEPVTMATLPSRRNSFIGFFVTHASGMSRLPVEAAKRIVPAKHRNT